MANVQFVITVDSAGAVTGINAVNSGMANIGTTANTSATQATSAFDRLEATINKMKSAVVGFIGAFLFREAIRGMEDIIQAGIDFEASFMRIRMTLGGTAGDFTGLEQDMRNMAKVIPIAVDELNRIAEAAAQVGIQKDKIKDFTQTIAEITVATGIPAEEATKRFARLANIMGIPIESIKSMASAMVDLDAKFPASTQEILAFSMNIAGAGKVVGLSIDQVEALATTLASVGLKSEKAGSAISKVFFEMQRAITSHGVALQNFASISGQTADQFSKAFKDNAGQALLTFLTGLDKVKESGIETTAALDALGLKNVRIADVVIRSSLAHEKLAEAMQVAKAGINGAGESLDTRYNTALMTTEDQLKLVQGRIHDLFIGISKDLQPAVLATAKGFADLLTSLKDNSDQVMVVIRTFAALGSALASIKLLEWLANAAAAFNPLRLAIVTTTAALVDFIVKWSKYKEDQAAIEEANHRTNTSLNEQQQIIIKGINYYEKLGFRFDVAHASMADLEKAVKSAQEAWQEHLKIVSDNTAETAKHEAAIKLVTAVQEKYQEKIKNGADAVTDESKKQKELIDILRLLQQRHADVTATMDVYGAQIKKLLLLHPELGIGILGILSPYRDFIDVQNEEIQTGVVLAGVIQSEQQAIELEVTFIKMRTLALGNMLQLVTAVTLKQIALNEAIKEGGVGDINSPANFIPNPAFHPFVPGTSDPFNKSQQKSAEDYAKEMEKNLNSALDRVFERMTQNGKLAWKDVAQFATDVFKPMLDRLFAPLKSELSSLMNGPMKAIGDKLSGLATGAGNAIAGLFGGSSGGGISKAISGVVSGGLSAAISIGVDLLAKGIGSLFGKLHKQADDFVKNFQNPFGDSMKSLLDSLNTAKDAGTLTTAAVTDAKKKLADMWAAFQAQAATLGKVGQQGLATMTPLVSEWFKFIDSLDATAASMERYNAMNKFVGKLTDSFSDWQAIEDAVKTLMDSGYSMDQIIKFLGNDISNAGDAMKTLGATIPPATQAILDQIAAEKAASDATKKLQEDLKALATVQASLDTLQTQLTGAYVSKMDLLDSMLAKSQSTIDTATTSINTLSDALAKNIETLNDAKHWTDLFASSISSVQSAYDKAIKSQDTLVQDIFTLSRKTQEDQYQIVIDSSKGSIAAVYAQKQLNALKLKFEREDIEARTKQLAELQSQTGSAAFDVSSATSALAAAKAEAAIDIAKQKADLIDQIATEKEKIATAKQTILVEQQQIVQLNAVRESTQSVMTALGIVRLDDIQKIDATIAAIQANGIALEKQRNDLETLTGTALTTSNIFKLLGLAITQAGGAALESIRALMAASAVAGGSGIPNGSGGFLSLEEESAAQAAVYENFQGNAYGSTTTLANGAVLINLAQPGTLALSGGSAQLQPFASGMDFVPRDMNVRVHKGERIIPASENTGSHGGDVHIHFNINALDGTSVERVTREKIYPELEAMWRSNSRKSKDRTRLYLGVS